jgi:ribosomal protein L11 methyltransferase
MEQRKFINVTISVLEEDYEIAYSILTDLEFIGMEEKLDEIILSFEEKNWNKNIQKELEQKFATILPTAKITNIQTLFEKNWNEEWEKKVEPVIISDDMVITPEWKKEQFDCKYKILINPKMSFGTGQHSTTKLMSQMLVKFYESDTEHKKNIWIDAGTGTGILAIIAAKLGAKKIFAFDNDIWSYENALENVELNNVAEAVEVTQSDIASFDFPSSDCICANMFLGLIKSAFPFFHKSLLVAKGILFVSGILLFDREELLEAAKSIGFILIEETQEFEWCCFKFKII